MTEIINPFLEAIVRQKQEVELKKRQFDLMESRFEHQFNIKYYKIDNQVFSYLSMPFDCEPVLEKSEIDAGLLELKKLGIIPKEQVYILNDLDVADTAQSIMYDPETDNIWDMTVRVECLVEDSYFDELKKTWILPWNTRKVEFRIVPIRNKTEEFDFSNFYEFSIKSMEKMTNYMQINDEDGVKKIYLDKTGPQTISANIIQNDWEQIIRVKVVINENSQKWLTHYICFKTKQ